MLQTIDDSYLATLKPPRLEFRARKELPKVLKPVWAALHGRKTRTALKCGYTILREEKLSKNERAGLLGALASAEWEHGVVEEAASMANESLGLAANQWLSRHVLITRAIAEGDFESAADHLNAPLDVKKTAGWDEILSEKDRHLVRATCAWMTKNWDLAAKHLRAAFPDGVESMPLVLQEDWFRLAFYRERADDAAAAARQLILRDDTEKADVLLQTLVRHGWHRQALALYRSIYEQDPQNELLRRRIVGLHIREGEVVEARRLMEQGALRLAV